MVLQRQATVDHNKGPTDKSELTGAEEEGLKENTEQAEIGMKIMWKC